MIKYTIFLLEDNLEQIQQLRLLIAQYNTECKHSLCLIAAATLAEGKALLANTEEPIDAFFLDIALDQNEGAEDENSQNTDGILFARHLASRPEYQDTPICFLSVHHFYLPSLLNHLHCFCFLQKPFTAQELFRQLDDLLDIKKQPLLLKTLDGIYTAVVTNQLIYIQSHGRNLMYVTIHGTFCSRQYSMKELSKILPGNFFRCHKSYIINQNFVANYDFRNHYAGIICSHTKTIPLSHSITLKNIDQYTA